jgi:Tol biopolymer transport system component
MPDGLNRTIGLAEYTNATFWTEDTFDDYPHPSLEDTNYDEDVWRTLEPVDAEDAITDHRMYFSKTTGDPVQHFMAAGYWFHQLYKWNKWEVIHSAFILDERCLEDYAEKLIPRAIGYSAALLDYFFRGSMDVEQIKLQGDSQWISGLDFEVKNTTLLAEGSTVEAFENGSLSLAYRYMLPGESEPQFGLAADIYTVGGLADPINDDFVPVSVAFPDDGYIPADATNVTFTLVFRGRLGNENDAVVGKVFTEPSWIAYSYRPDGWPNPSHIYTELSDGSEREKISSDDWDLQWFFSPAWGPHGMSLAFESAYDGCAEIGGCGYYGTRKIVVVDMTSRTVMSNLIINDESHAHPIHTLIHPSFSPDGSQIAAAAIGTGTEGSTIYAVVVFDVQTGAWHYINGYGFWDRGITWENLSSVSWSPLGDKIAYAIHEDSDSEALNIHTISPSGTDDIQLTFGDYRNGDPSWSHDGEWIVFVSDRDGEGNLDVWSMDKNGENMRKIINCSSGCSSPSFSPDGSKIVFSGGITVYTADFAGSNVEVLEGNAEGPAWSH